MPQLSPRKGMPSPRLSAAEFRERFLSQFQDPSFEPLASELDRIAAAAARLDGRPHPAGTIEPGFFCKTLIAGPARRAGPMSEAEFRARSPSQFGTPRSRRATRLRSAVHLMELCGTSSLVHG